MCGIVAVLRRPSDRVAPGLKLIVAALDEAEVSLRPYVTAPDAAGISAVAQRIAAIEHALRGTGGTIALLADPVALSALEHRAASLTNVVVDLDAALDAYDSGIEIEALNAAVVSVKDALWALSRDRLRTARAVEHLGSGAREPRAIEAFHSVQVALSALDRLEVRGRDSAGLHILVTGHGLDLADPTIARLIATRRDGCARRSPPTSSCGSRCGPTPPKRWCSRTHDGRASASSPRRTRTPSTRRNSAPTVTTHTWSRR